MRDWRLSETPDSRKEFEPTTLPTRDPANVAAGPSPPPATDKFSGPDAPSVLEFGFRHCNRPYRGTLTRDKCQAPVKLHGHVGELPFSAQSPPARREILRLMNYKSVHGRLQLAAGQRIVFHGEPAINLPFTGIDVVTAIVQTLIEEESTITPILTRLKEAEAYFVADAASSPAATSSPAK